MPTDHSTWRFCEECGVRRIGPLSKGVCHSCRVKRMRAAAVDWEPINKTGFCMCGCGQRTDLAKLSLRARGWVLGKPLPFLPGHTTRRLMSYTVDPDTGCWILDRLISRANYGCVKRNGKWIGTHRLFYEQKHGPIPDGLHLDHLCRTPACVNPDHLEPVTITENIRRGNAAKLNPEKVRIIRSLLGSVTGAELARRFGVSPATITEIKYRRKWVDIE